MKRLVPIPVVPTMKRSRWVALLTCIVAVAAPTALASAASEPQLGGWKGKTSQGYPVYIGVRAGSVTNFRITYRDPICGKQSTHLPSVSLAIDEPGQFAGTLIPYRLEVSGSFLSATKLKGTIVALETTGLPGCLRQVSSFTAVPR